MAMTTPKRYRDAYPGVIAREHFIKAAGEEHDPQFAGCMVRIIDSESNYQLKDLLETVESEMECGEYRDNVSNGIMIEDMVKMITFNCESTKEKTEDFSAPSIILYDSFDRKVHSSEQSIEGYHYLEYGEVWFDEHSITTAARKIREESIDDSNNTQPGHYEIEAAKYDDHMKLVMKGPEHSKEVIVALTNSSKSVYIGLTGEHCKLSDIIVKQTGKQIGSGEIPRIESEINFTDRMEADVKNIQVDSPRAAYTTGVRIKDRMHLAFHTMSLPAADFIWHCPYIVLFYSDDGNVNGPNYHEYALIKLNGESDAEKEHAHNYFTMKKKDSFPGWDKWKELNLAGMECNIEFEKRGNRVTTTTENLGIYLENVTEISDDVDMVYVSLTGDQCALTDIRVQ